MGPRAQGYFNAILKNYRTGALTIITTLLVLVSVNFHSKAHATIRWKMPWPAGFTPQLTQGVHQDGLVGGLLAFDLSLPAGTPVLAPIDSTVVRHCIAQGTDNHRSILLRTRTGQQYSLGHVTTSTVQRSYRQGEQIGVVAPEQHVDDPRCATSTGAHLHFGLPQVPTTIDNQTLTRFSTRGEQLTSTNQRR
ncbi:peptidoglycan DD-metalloendopeptidase family protein [Nodosilinea sp. E11]|uniref:peptidoglycan DD-metalloendopeptidase family protein n=1 Tax=Nodosilinea sp. E11 TaxID=3037479 RepID=UPI002934779C|nr:peptidoglycan DD-metalloendopeptidase family protein [Nodosilinea sp. E11]WOD38263.1 peptidoglycan DD-metalloendopeptidase family protein [Nodosilinea sp. E11]